jgi:uncharacterized protein YxeA
MKKIVAITAALLIAAALTAGALAAQERTGPRIEFKQERYDFGKVTEGDQAVHVFEFTNTGDAVLEIQKVQTS